MSRRTRAALIIACATLLTPLTGCSSGHDDKASAATRSSEPSPKATPTASSTKPAVQQPPELDADETLAGRQKATTGNAALAFTQGRKGDALIVAVRCQGAGKIKVSVRSVHLSFPLECQAGEVSTTYDQVAVKGVEHRGVVSVEASSAVHWSMTIGRGTPAAEDTPTSTAESL
ncbi:hypothetical protein ACFWFU_22585 [Streptomyces sp. NPDC060235]|uniref:hypothetical protein n=1 Tax=Streptomyces sp. NPDC060235 TaxID=3347080 RepID=UPI003664BD80